MPLLLTLVFLALGIACLTVLSTSYKRGDGVPKIIYFRSANIFHCDWHEAAQVLYLIVRRHREDSHHRVFLANSTVSPLMGLCWKLRRRKGPPAFFLDNGEDELPWGEVRVLKVVWVVSNKDTGPGDQGTDEGWLKSYCGQNWKHLKDICHAVTVAKELMRRDCEWWGVCSPGWEPD